MRSPAWSSVLAADQGEKIDLCRRGPGALARALSLDPRPDRSEHTPLHGVAVTLVLPQGVADGGQPRFSSIAPEDIGEAHLARRDLYRRTRHRRFAEIERSALASD